MMKIKLTGKHAVGDLEFAWVDDEDYPIVSPYPWNLSVEKKENRRDFYSVSTKIKTDDGRKTVNLHQMVMGFPDVEVDHKDHNRLDNQKSNLRLCENGENLRNRRGNINSNCEYVGVCWIESRNSFRAGIYFNDRSYYLGSYKDAVEAAEIRDLYALKYVGDFAYLNFPEKKDEYISKFDTIDIHAKKEFSSQQKGASWDESRQKWSANIYSNGKSTFLGRFDTEEDAARAFDKAVIDYGLSHDLLNYPNEIDKSIARISSLSRAKANSTGFNGVKKIREGYYGAKVTVDKKEIWLGTFADPVEAAKAYDKAVIEYGLSLRKLNFKDAA